MIFPLLGMKSELSPRNRRTEQKTSMYECEVQTVDSGPAQIPNSKRHARGKRRPIIACVIGVQRCKNLPRPCVDLSLSFAEPFCIAELVGMAGWPGISSERAYALVRP